MLLPKIYGSAPANLGQIDLSPTEMLFWLYCPIKLPGTSAGLSVPDNLKQFMPIIETCMEDCDEAFWRNNYVYLTAKNVYTTPDNTAQRPGWHCDGFMTTDINYIWADREPTLFWVPPVKVPLPQDHAESMLEMANDAQLFPQYCRTYPLKNLLRLDQTVIHRVADFQASGMRAFVKLSVSEHPFNLIGNSINHQLSPDWHYSHRSAGRNPEVAKQTDFASPDDTHTGDTSMPMSERLK